MSLAISTDDIEPISESQNDPHYIDMSELSPASRKRLEQFDADGDGFISSNELRRMGSVMGKEHDTVIELFIKDLNLIYFLFFIYDY